MGLSSGMRLGPYEILAPLGAGGMGEVWRARDTRLDRQVAIKVLPGEFVENKERRTRFEREAKALAAVNHPNVAVIHSFEEVFGQFLLVQELLEGESLREVLFRRSPTQRQVLGWAVQTAQGLAAAHQKGVVHRDLKPENLFLTQDGRIKILDFGLAKQTGPSPHDAEEVTASSPTNPGAVMGTIAYMSPEQAQGRPADARSDLFSFGVTFYELLARKHPFRRDTVAATLGAILQETPAPLPSLDPSIPRALDGIVRRCLEKQREERFQGAHDLGLALEAVLAAPSGSALLDEVEEKSPYPGMASFTERDASVFFGREAEVKALWERILQRPLLGVIGPSGAGKTSLLRAGVMASRPDGWAVAYATPGSNPAVGLARGLTPELAGDASAIGALLGGVAELTNSGDTGLMLSAVKRWRAGHDEALLVVDQFEELFTLSAPEAQQRFAALLGRLVNDGGIHVVLSMRDDFLIRCSALPALARVFEHLTPLLAVSGEGLRRAFVEPARKRGFGFEDDELVDEMVKAVEGERAALPLLAFAVSRLWEKRDRENRLLARKAYEEIGGVAGALAQHAEATLDGIGNERQGLVREIFRNLVTAQGTRAVCDRDELLSALPNRTAAEDVLGRLVDARLLTSYEVDGKEGEPGHHRVEIVHESLLSAWPRLVRWRTEDEGGAQLRDHLRQAARLWKEKGRPEDLLWTGTSYREYSLWRERYPGGLSEAEEAFGHAMVARAGQRRRVRRMAYAAVLAAVSLTAIAIGVSRQRAVSEKRRAEAAQVLALGRLRLADHPNGSLAYAIASLERADNDPARRFAVEALWQGPPALYLPDEVVPADVQWSPDGRWLALGGTQGLALFDRETPGRRGLLTEWEAPLGFSSDGKRFVSGPPYQIPIGPGPAIHVWTLPEGRLERTLQHAEKSDSAIFVDDRVLTFAFDKSAPEGDRPALVRRLSLDGTTEEQLGRWELRGSSGRRGRDVDPSGTWIYSMQRGRLLEQRLDALSAPARVLGTHEGTVSVRLRPWHDRAVTSNNGGEIRIWDVPSARLVRALKSPASARQVALDPKGRLLAAGATMNATARALFLFDLEAPRSAEPMPLLNGEAYTLNDMAFSPDGAWLATMSHPGPATLWNVHAPHSTVLGRQKPIFVTVAFTRDGRIISSSDEGVVRSWPLSAAADEGARDLWSRPGAMIGGFPIALDPSGRFAVVCERWRGKVHVVPLNGSPATIHPLKVPQDPATHLVPFSLDPGGRKVALAYSEAGNPAAASIRVLDLSTGEERTLDTHARGDGGCEKEGSLLEGAAMPEWLSDGRLVSDGDAGLRVWDLTTGTSEQLRPCKKLPEDIGWLLATPDSRGVVRLDPASKTAGTSSLSLFDLASRTTREITSHGNRIVSFALDGAGTILVTGSFDGVVRVGPLAGAEPHLLFGHTGPVTSVAVSPDGRSIASGSDDGTIRLWPMPELSRPPMHTLPHDELLAKLKSLTNLRAVRDPASDTGWKIEIGPFPGWKDVPTWQP
ncbi:MAG: protein kinase [Acidobacteriota bacterium]